MMINFIYQVIILLIKKGGGGRAKPVIFAPGQQK
jgi:hypothetical protein